MVYFCSYQLNSYQLNWNIDWVSLNYFNSFEMQMFIQVNLDLSIYMLHYDWPTLETRHSETPTVPNYINHMQSEWEHIQSIEGKPIQ